jgi:tRNA-Thr(GGU) m(6)t(6)A37 methyltransferase TsaA
MAEGDQPELEPIGIVRSSLRRRKNAPRSPADGAPEAVLEQDERFAAALEGVSPGMELIAVTWLHEGLRDVLQVRPGRDPARPLTGVFATRSPDRPNPIGLHRVLVTSVEPPTRVHVSALDAIDGTPILDLKLAVDAREARGA